MYDLQQEVHGSRVNGVVHALAVGSRGMSSGGYLSIGNVSIGCMSIGKVYKVVTLTEVGLIESIVVVLK